MNQEERSIISWLIIFALFCSAFSPLIIEFTHLSSHSVEILKGEYHSHSYHGHDESHAHDILANFTLKVEGGNNLNYATNNFESTSYKIVQDTLEFIVPLPVKESGIPSISDFHFFNFSRIHLPPPDRTLV